MEKKDGIPRTGASQLELQNSETRPMSYTLDRDRDRGTVMVIELRSLNFEGASMFVAWLLFQRVGGASQPMRRQGSHYRRGAYVMD